MGVNGSNLFSVSPAEKALPISLIVGNDIIENHVQNRWFFDVRLPSDISNWSIDRDCGNFPRLISANKEICIVPGN